MVARERSSPERRDEGAGEPSAQALRTALRASRVLASGRESAVRAEQLLRVLDGLAAAPPSEDAAAELVRALDEHQLDLEDADGRSCRAAAVGVLLAYGYPHALHLTPEDLQHYRSASRPGLTRWGVVALSAGVAGMAGFQLSTFPTVGTAVAGGLAAALAWGLSRRFRTRK